MREEGATLDRKMMASPEVRSFTCTACVLMLLLSFIQIPCCIKSYCSVIKGREVSEGLLEEVFEQSIIYKLV